MGDFINIKQELRWGDWYFKDHVIPDDFDYRVHKKERSSYYAARGFDASMMYSDYYSRFNGIASDRYMPMDVYFFYALPCLNRWDLRLAYTDKNLYDMLFPRVRQAKTVIKNINGIVYDGEGRILSLADAVRLCERESEDCIIKPTLDTCNGKGVGLLDASSVQAQLSMYGVNYIVQRKVCQHEKMAQLNASSLNSLRIFTYRTLAGEIRNLYTFLRFGGSGSVMDNASTGGGYCKVFPDGRVEDRINRYKTLAMGSLKRDKLLEDFYIPSYAAAVDAALEMHATLPYFDYIGWDIAIDTDGVPVLIEFNVLANIGSVQVTHGPVFGEYLDEVMDRISIVKKQKTVYSVNKFRPGFNYLLPIG